ncbi:MAG: hypothetical protein QOG31_303 [Thermoplasmata archaeon]|jgi:hypothetical protein|nr:hypothetical protein [Thermoplasmata archaeon]
MSRFISLLLASSLFLAVLAVAPASAGTQQAPEVTDPEHDIALLAGNCVNPSPAPAPVVCLPGCTIPSPSPVACLGDVIDQTTTEAGFGGDVVHAWVDHENGTAFLINIETHGDPRAGLADADPVGPSAAEVRLVANFTVNGKARSAIAHFTGDGPSVGGVATSMSYNATGHITSLSVPKAAFGNFTVGTTNMTGLFVVGTSRVVGSAVPNPGAPDPAPSPLAPAGTSAVFTDRAPDAGGGLRYNFTLANLAPSGNGTANPTDPNLGGAPGCTYKSGEANRTDQDADCLPDHWETQYFSGITQQNGTGDPDGDGCSNRCEYLHGTDPMKRDTDGDGVSDGDEVKAGTDPLDPTSFPGAANPTPTTTSQRPTTTTGATTTGGGTATSTGTTSQSALDKIQADAGYAVASGAAMGAIVLLSLIGLFGRWGA